MDSTKTDLTYILDRYTTKMDCGSVVINGFPDEVNCEIEINLLFIVNLIIFFFVSIIRYFGCGYVM